MSIKHLTDDERASFMLCEATKPANLSAQRGRAFDVDVLAKSGRGHGQKIAAATCHSQSVWAVWWTQAADQDLAKENRWFR